MSNETASAGEPPSGHLGPRPSAPRVTRRGWMILSAIVLCVLALPTLLWLRCGIGGCPNVDRLRSYQPGKASQLLDRHGRAFADLKPVEAETAPLTAIPKHVRDAFISVEDQRFRDHGGVDLRRVLGAMLANVRAGGVAQGSSTITMQLARNVFPDRLPAAQRTLTRKLMEVRVAYAIEDRYSKDEILELYLSHIYFGNGARGIEAAARHYFGVSTARLSQSQGAMLAALPKSPTHYNPRRHPDKARERRDLVLTLMEQQGRLTPAMADAARAAPLGLVRRRAAPGQAPGLAPWFVEHVRHWLEEEIGERLYDESLRIQTTLDSGLQRAAEEELTRQLAAISSKPLQGAVVALEARTGDVLAWVGGRDFNASRFDRVKNAERQAGSAFKPFVYGAALDEGHVLSERLADEPATFPVAGGRTWEPRNFDGRFDGAVSMRDALVRSKNLPTIRLGADVGLGDVADLAHEAGIQAEIDETPAMPLGTVAVNPLELATAYTAFATLGEAVAPRIVLSVKAEDGDELWKADDPEPRRVMKPGVAYLITHVLQEAVDRGTGTAVRTAGYAGPAAGKTGTTNGATDAWFVGYTPEVVTAVWIGFDEPQSIGADATGGRIAAPVWARIMARRGGPVVDWQRPDDVVERWVDAVTGALLDDGCRPAHGRGYAELFLRGSLPDDVCPDRGQVLVADAGDVGGLAEQATDDIWPEEMGGSEPAPPPDYEEAEPERGRGWRKKGRQREREGGQRSAEQRREREKRREEWDREDRKRAEEQQRERGKRRDERGKKNKEKGRGKKDRDR